MCVHAEAIVSQTPYLLARARRLTRNEADASDLVQDTCLQALEVLSRADAPPENIRAWLLVVMRNHWFNIVRHRRVRASAQIALASGASHDSGLHDTSAVSSQLTRAWSKLSAQAQTIAQQCLLNGDSHQEVSERVGISVNGVAASIHRTREILRRVMFEPAM